MENASKALIIAGSVLIALMIIGALILMFTNLSSYQTSNTQTVKEAQIVEFNNQYTTYDRNDVRGSDLYSLINKAIDYNERKSTEGTEGAEIAYEPMKIKILINQSDLSQFTADNGRTQLLGSSYEVSNTSNTFKTNVVDKLKNITNSNFTDKVYTNLCTGLTKIFTEASTNSEKLKAINNFNSAYGDTYLSTDSDRIESSWNKIKKDSEIRKNVYAYYEYVQFKRAHFNCTGRTYNKNTGRITELDFEFNGKFN